MKKDEEKVRKLVELREYLRAEVEKRVKELEVLRGFLAVLDDLIAGMSFKTAYEVSRPEERAEKAPSKRRVVVIKSRDGRELAVAEYDEEELVIRPKEELRLDVKTPPFIPFLVNKVLLGMKVSDRKLVMEKKLEPDKVISYEVETDDDVLKELRVKNYREEGRVKRIIDAARWTFERMLARSRREG